MVILSTRSNTVRMRDEAPDIGRRRRMISLNVNGKTMALDVEPDTPLLWALRDFAGLTGTKYGCGGALCGVCTVHIYGRPMRSCVTPVSAAVGRKITTIEAIGATRARQGGAGRLGR